MHEVETGVLSINCEGISQAEKYIGGETEAARLHHTWQVFHSYEG